MARARLPSQSSVPSSLSDSQLQSNKSASFAVHHGSQVYSLLIDNYDSYSYNICQMLAQINGIPPMVVKNDAQQTNYLQVWNAFLQQKKILEQELEVENLYYNVVISPGPGRPNKQKDIGFCNEMIELCVKNKVPVLGVCLGHQIIGAFYGARIVKSPNVVHGQHSWIRSDMHEKVDADLDKTHLFSHIPIGGGQGIQVVRYHSLIVSDPLPDCLQCLARTCKMTDDEADENLIMAIRHRQLPVYGVQFHPEAICSQFGFQIFQNFRDLTTFTPPSRCSLYYTNSSNRRVRTKITVGSSNAPSAYVIVIEKSECPSCPKFASLVYERMFAGSGNAFWLDSSNFQLGSEQQNQSRFSFMGDTRGPLAKLYEYCAVSQDMCVTECNTDVQIKEHVEDCLSFLRQELERYRSHTVRLLPTSTHTNSSTWQPPFGFRGGFVGYFGYEALLSNVVSPSNSKVITEMKKRLQEGRYVPDVSIIFADRTLVFDHENNDTYFVSVSKTEAVENTLQNWHVQMRERLKQCCASFDTFRKSDVGNQTLNSQPSLQFQASCSPEEYRVRICKAQEYIQQGETYEVCLTNQITVHNNAINAFQLYNILRLHNPAPFAAYYTCNAGTRETACGIGFVKHYSICCSSPERFLKLSGDGWMESKPIKGTRPRGSTKKEDEVNAQDLASSVKDRAENMMITDLVRNDFGAVAEIGSVHVPSLMKVETFATVHQLVTSVRARLASRHADDLRGGRKLDFFDLFRAAFPGGSMTGAPKLRTMEIIAELEEIPRSVYSGALGYLSIPSESSGSGTIADFNIIIRTAVITPNSVNVGAGGAIVALSDPEEEYEEMWLKTKAIREALLRL